MNKSELKVFIVDDDPTISKALKELVTQLGYQPIMCMSPADALNQFRIQGGTMAIIDCLLPKMSGVELAKAIHGEFGENIPIILTSGVYKDKSFIKDSLTQSKAIGFFSKPFQINELSDMINKTLAGKFDEELLPLEIFLTGELTPAEKIKELNKIGELEAFDLPWICCSLMNSNVTGALKLSTPKQKSSISFFQGRIVQVEMPNPESFFGALLIEKDFVTSAQIDKVLTVKSNKKIGERLVDMNLLSPHVIAEINAEQTAIRLSKLIHEEMYKVTFSEDIINDVTVSIDTETISPFLVDWINSKIPTEWIKRRYLKWLNRPPTKTTAVPSYRRLWSLSPLKDSPDLIANLTQGSTLSQELSSSKFSEDSVYAVFHLLVTIGHVFLKRETKTLDETAQTDRLQKIHDNMKGQDYFSILGTARTAKSADFKKLYYELAKVFHPDKVPANASTKLKELAKTVFSQMTLAYETLSDDAKRTEYVKEIELGRAEKVLQAESLIEDGKSLLKLGQAVKALEKFEGALKLRPPNSELWIHLAWAKMLSGKGTQAERLTDVEGILNKIPPEDRHNATYYFVKGFYLKLNGDLAPARKNLQNALVLNPKFLDAERLLRTFDASKKKGSTDIFTGDLTKVVGNLFKKK